MLRYALLLGLLSVTFAAQPCLAQRSSSSRKEKTLRQYSLKLTQYRLEKPIKTSSTSEEILALIGGLKSIKGEREGVGGEVLETIRLTLVSNIKSTAEFGRNVNVVVGQTKTRNGSVMKQIETMAVGSTLEATVSKMEEKLLLTISFSTSNLGKRVSEEARPDVGESRFKTTLVLEPGKPTILGSSTKNGTVFVVTVDLSSP